MLFGKKKQSKELPIEDVRKMAARGVPDRDIIKELKHNGYSYNDIEKAMLQAVKDGVDEKPEEYAQPLPQPDFAPQFQQTQAQVQAQPVFDMPAVQGETIPELDAEQAGAILEELVEGVIDEKWQKFEARVDKMEETFDKIRAEIRQFEDRIGQEKKQSPTRDIELRINDISEQLDDMDARVGGLEKAFKQFLPSLTKNIESLAQLVHQVKERNPALEA